MMHRYCVDTNVLLRLQDLHALEFVAQLTDCELVLTDYVWDEVTRKPGAGAAARKILSASPNVIHRQFLPNEKPTVRFVRLRDNYNQAKYHEGELSVIALASCEPELIPVVFEFRGHIAACDELRRSVMTGHWFFSALAEHHGLPLATFAGMVDLLAEKNYPIPTWYVAQNGLPPV